MKQREDCINNRLLVIGLDGGTWSVLDPLIEKGFMPNLRKLKEEGSSAILNSTIPPLTPPAWTSFMTGVNPAKHGILNWFSQFEQNGEYNFINSTYIQTKTLWELLSNAGKNIAIINVPITYPPQKVNGILISGFLTPSKEKDYTYPTELKNELNNYVIETDYFSATEEKILFGTSERKKPNRKQIVKDLIEVEKIRGETCIRFLEEDRYDFFMVVFRGVDLLQHYFWDVIEIILKDHNLRSCSTQDRELHDLVVDYYALVDDLIGKIVRAMGNNCGTIIISDHGFQKGPEKSVNVRLMFENQPLKSKVMRKVIPNKVSKILRFYKKTYREEKENVWYKQEIGGTKLTLMPLINDYAGLKIDIPREKFKKYQKYRDKVIDKLRKVVDPENGNYIVKEIFKSDKIFSGPFTKFFPDIVFRLDSTYLVSGNGPMISEMSSYDKKGDHHINGIFLAHGPSILSGLNLSYFNNNSNISIMDISPTILYYLGVPIIKYMDGYIIKEIFDKEFLSNVPELYSDQENKLNLDQHFYSKSDKEIIENRLKELDYL